MILEEIVEFQSGSPQFRINEVNDLKAPSYYFYDQNCLLEDALSKVRRQTKQLRSVRTYDEVVLTQPGDLVYSLISGDSAIVSKDNQGLLLTQNFIRLKPVEKVDLKYLLFVLNESEEVEKQLYVYSQGSSIIKYTLSLIKHMDIPLVKPSEQIKIGNIYYSSRQKDMLIQKKMLIEKAAVNDFLERKLSHAGK